MDDVVSGSAARTCDARKALPEIPSHGRTRLEAHLPATHSRVGLSQRGSSRSSFLLFPTLLSSNRNGRALLPINRIHPPRISASSFFPVQLETQSIQTPSFKTVATSQSLPIQNAFSVTFLQPSWVPASGQKTVAITGAEKNSVSVATEDDTRINGSCSM